MKMKRFFKYALSMTIMFSAAGAFTSCGDDDDYVPTKPEVKTVNLDAQSFTDWTYFSFEKGGIITVDQKKYADDSNWDMGFLRFNIRTNGGESGKGKGAALDTGKKTFDEVTTIPSSGFITDTQIKVMTSGAMPPKYTQTAGSAVFKVGDNQGWAKFDPTTMVWSFNNNVFVVRTANGKYAKVIMKSFLNDADKSGHITFDYIYPFE